MCKELTTKGLFMGKWEICLSNTENSERWVVADKTGKVD